MRVMIFEDMNEEGTGLGLGLDSPTARDAPQG